MVERRVKVRDGGLERSQSERADVPGLEPRLDARRNREILEERLADDRAGPLQSLCPACHSRDKQQLERSGFVRGCDRDGVPLDPSHPWRQELERERADPGGAITDPQGSTLNTGRAGR